MTELDRDLLDFAALRFKYAGAQEAEIRARFGMTRAAYFQRLNKLLDTPEALAYAPVTVNRLRRVREAARMRRAG